MYAERPTGTRHVITWARLRRAPVVRRCLTTAGFRGRDHADRQMHPCGVQRGPASVERGSSVMVIRLGRRRAASPGSLRQPYGEDNRPCSGGLPRTLEVPDLQIRSYGKLLAEFWASLFARIARIIPEASDG